MLSFNSLRGATDDPNRENTALPHRINVEWHYNILSPAGYGPNQVRSCIGCTFKNIFSHGGTALRVETDAVSPAVSGVASFAIVDDLNAERIMGINGNRVVALVPHLQKNGVVKVRLVMGVSEYELVLASVGEPGGTGSFAAGTRVHDIQGASGEWAQDHLSGGYKLAPSSVAINNTGPMANVDIGGDLCWPALGKPGGLADGDVVSGTKVKHGKCPAWP